MERAHLDQTILSNASIHYNVDQNIPEPTKTTRTMKFAVKEKNDRDISLQRKAFSVPLNLPQVCFQTK